MAASVKIAVRGMTCSSCSGTVQKALSSMPDVVAAKVDLKTQQAHVALAPGASTSIDQLINRVIACGFEVEVLEDREKVVQTFLSLYPWTLLSCADLV
jgi:cation transport ATPase